MPDVTDREDPGQAGLQEHRHAPERPLLIRPPVVEKVAAGDDEPPLVEPDGVRQPLGARLGPDQDEQGRRSHGLGRAGFQIGEGQALQAAPSGTAGDRDPVADGDVGPRFDLPDEVLGHAVGQRPSPDEHGHLRGVPGEVDRGLPGGVGATYHEDLAVLHGLGLGGGSAVEHSGSGQRVERRDAQAPVGHAGGDDHRPAADLGPAGQGDRELRALSPQAGSRVAIHVLRAEVPGLRVGPHGQVSAAHPGREAEVVADQRARAGLAADRFRLQDHGGQTLRRAVHRRGQASRARPDHGHVVAPLPRLSLHADRLGHLRVRRVGKDPAVEQHHRGPGAPGRPGLPEQALPLRAPGVVEAERDAVAPEQLAELV